MGKVNKKSDQGCQGKANAIEDQLYLGEFTGTVSCLLPTSALHKNFCFNDETTNTSDIFLKIPGKLK